MSAQDLPGIDPEKGEPPPEIDKAPVRKPLAHPVLEKEAEEARDLLQRRIALFGLYAALFQAAFFLLWIFVGPFIGTAVAVQFLAPVISISTWWIVQRRHLSFRTLWALDFGTIFLLCAAYALNGVARNSFQKAFLPASYLLLLRAVFLPSGSLRTLIVSAASYLPALICIPQILRETAGPESWFIFAATLVFWIVDPAIVSHVIYGLREEARDARKLGPYTIEKLIGRGGMGEVYKARHNLLKRETAVKILLPSEEDTAALRFEHEVQITSQLTHPNTVAVYDYGHTPDGRFYYVMEYLPGINLADLVKRFGPQPPARVIHLLSQACGSLGEAHGKGIIHRDIKPANLILCERGGLHDFVKVVDFGLVKNLRRKPTEDLTAPNVVMGTVLYMPPEAITNPEKMDGRSDLYVLGAVGYYLLTAEPPFPGSDIIEVSVAQLSTQPRRPSEVLGKPVPEDLENLIFACLDKEMDGRPKSARALQEALAKLQEAGSWTQEKARAWWQENFTRGPIGA